MQIMKVDPRALKENPDRMRQSKSAAQADALMLVQYRDGETHTLYYGPMQPALDSARVYGSSFELVLSVARRLAAG